MRRFWKFLKFLIGLGIGLFVAAFMFVTVFGQTHPQIFTKADAVIVLGAAINTPALYNRSLQGLKVYESGQANLMILSGGRISDQDISEAEYMKKVILKNASNEVPMLLEEDSHSTYENLKNAKSLAPKVRSLVVVSDRFHLARAVLVAKSLGFGPVYWRAPDPSYYPGNELIFYYFREAAALLVYLPKLIGGYFGSYYKS